MTKKIALVTGAGQGIGKAIALRLSRDGFNVAINDINGVLAENVAKDVREQGTDAIAVQADIAVAEHVQAMVDKTVEHFGRLDVMVANAGIVQVESMLDVSESNFDKLFAINVKGVLWCSQSAARQMIAQGGGGKIINAASAAGHAGVPLMGTYSASKFSVRALTQVLAKELAGYGITVNAYCPGIVETPMWEEIDEKMDAATGAEKGASMKSILEMIPLGRVQIPEDVANLVSYFASSDSDYMTGQSVLIDGGLLMK
ncbi:meso-butanediol dehydrogenase / (S,S)-butanediol dehydrogenase / diacetyl reductase [Desulfocicer vacuolatum DSM 3385]|uniref:diacetyl reductase [(S)-acetoin forming] n=1 Tax=Desulfocicer vacuolatum DSM 3385 TaxID=1121400 RepID=A0A1W2D6A6_9BACT|nr:acetoin reductase [Desulfocicer vacuolatum]SMC92588.1 meso-butanediol dehydrogenase / (S,S)-butanediol dehydrogenase / diacetyl reductase [Desulfocicer vacuolatum DSM 3385]